MAYTAVTPRSALHPWADWIYVALKGLLVAAAFGGLGGLMWYSYAESARHGGKRVVPVIRAEAAPIKTRPAEPGGLRVPHKDKRVYERIAPQPRKKLANNVERLIPRPAPVAITPKWSSEGPRSRAPTVKVKPPAIVRPQIKGGPARVRVGVDHKRSRMAVKKSAPTKPAAKSARNLRATDLSSVAFRVQIAAYPSPQLAARRWERLAGKHKDLVGKLDWYVEKVDRTNGRGPLYRLQLGPLKNHKAARELCAKLGKRKVSCLFVRG
ncbi:MAG TPA: SPOR domain-containing protein [Alphaproteobacteria bacterium]|nr:SPOR domain-containing protein [Alphaproteobacteria bacterium]